MFKSLLCTVILVGALSAYAQSGGNSGSRSGSPTGMRGGFTERHRSGAISDIFQKTATLVHSTPEQLNKQYSSDASTCVVAPKSYVAVLMAEERLKLDRHQALQRMCENKTNSFAKALSADGTMKLQISGITGAQDLQARESAYMKEIDAAMKKAK